MLEQKKSKVKYSQALKDSQLEKEHRRDLKSNRTCPTNSRCCESHLSKGTNPTPCTRTHWLAVVQILRDNPPEKEHRRDLKSNRRSHLHSRCCDSHQCKGTHPQRTQFRAPGQDNPLGKKHRIDQRSSRRSHLHSKCCESHLYKGSHPRHTH